MPELTTEQILRCGELEDIRQCLDATRAAAAKAAAEHQAAVLEAQRLFEQYHRAFCRAQEAGDRARLAAARLQPWLEALAQIEAAHKGECP